ncbi:hypothetical protein F5Y19DRAFT_368483 [Xylariaceae sp. FL1651]|nr:hypothetical protein F5Y19DRAFT_368483 [Xylariaceae sp. FL1651]
MGGLIPLLLHSSAGSRSSMGFPSTEPRRRSCLSRSSSSSTPQSHRRQQSLPSLKQAKRASLAASPALVVVPFTALEWKGAIDEVKRKYLARKYRSCSMQCCEILDNLKDTSAIEPLHLIYLHFYAASSFEWCARPLSSSSTYRTKLLRDAQTHYTEAETLIAATECNMAERARSPSSISIMSPHSPGLSACSRTSSSSSAASSPRTSIFSLDEVAAKSGRRAGVKSKSKSKSKKVSFSSLPQFFEFQPEPYIRPDSPTLGWEDDLFMRPLDVDSSFPIPPKTTDLSSIMKSPVEEKILSNTTQFEPSAPLNIKTKNAASAMSEEADRDSNNAHEQYHERSSTPSNHAFDLESFLQTRSINRFCARLSALRDQVSRHRTAVDTLLAMPEDMSTILSPALPIHSDLLPAPCLTCASPSLSALPTDAASKPNHTDDNTKHNKNKPARPTLRLQTDMSNVAVRGHVHQGSVSLSASPCWAQSPATTYPHIHTPTTPMLPILSPVSAGGDEKLQQRIERLRASGWRRKRFDSRRYEALREQVLCELGPGC